MEQFERPMESDLVKRLLDITVDGFISGAVRKILPTLVEKLADGMATQKRSGADGSPQMVSGSETLA